MGFPMLESWDSYGGDATQCAKVWNGTCTFTTTAARVKTGTYAYGGGSGQANSRALTIAAATVYFGMWVYWTSAEQPAQGGLVLGFISGTVYDGFNAVCSLSLNTDGKLRITRTFNSGTTIATSATALNASAKNYIRGTITFGASGAYTIWQNGTQVLNGSGANLGGTTVNGIHIGNAPSYALDSLWIDTVAPSGFSGELIVTGFGNSSGNGANTGLTPSVGTNHGVLVDEAIANDDTDYNSGGAGVKDTYLFNTALLENYAISAVQVQMCARGTSAGTNTIAAVTRVAGADYDGTTTAITTTYAYWFHVWSTRPSDSGTWLQTDLNEFGMKSVAAVAVNRLTRIYIEVLSNGIATGGPEDVPVATIAGVLTRIKRNSLSITEVANGRNTLTCEVVSTDASVRPAVDSEVNIFLNFVLIFAGTVDKTTETGLGQKVIGINTRVSVNDFNSLADRRYLQVTLPAGTLKSMLESIVTYLSTYGVTLDPAQVTGPSLDTFTYDYRQVTEILNDLAALTGYVWEIDYEKVLRMYNPGTVAAPFDIVDGGRKALGDIAVDQTARTKYANRIILRAGSATIVEKYETFTGDGSTVDFPLTYTPGPETDGYQPFRGYITNAAVNEPLGVTTPPYWVFNTGTGMLTRSSAPANLNLIEVYYTVQFPITVIAEDLGEQALNGIIERMVEKPDVFDIDVAQALADAELAIGLERPNQVRYQTREIGLKPGMTQTVTAATRNVNATYLVTEIRSRDSGDALGTLIREVTATQGTTLKATWREVYKKWGSSGGASAPVA